MHHLVILNSALQDWTERALIQLVPCRSHANCSDLLTKEVGEILFACHMDIIGGGSF